MVSSRPDLPCYTHCCKSGDVILPFPLRPPAPLYQLYIDLSFLRNIRSYNSVFAMTSFRGVIDEEINKGRGHYVFKVFRQVYHWIGSLYPQDDKGP
uniref:Uncharacterized protein n=1 Tax=Lactuca sativa TaxID=4236 RepID=A0A9R1UY34_LACSA|nr:hypothetical protein LSAT_V11C700343180 [Lactuca sativa]